MGAGHMWPFLGGTWFRGIVMLPDIDLASPTCTDQFNNRPQSNDPSGRPECLGQGGVHSRSSVPPWKAPRAQSCLPLPLLPTQNHSSS